MCTTPSPTSRTMTFPPRETAADCVSRSVQPHLCWISLPLGSCRAQPAVLGLPRDRRYLPGNRSYNSSKVLIGTITYHIPNGAPHDKFQSAATFSNPGERLPLVPCALRGALRAPRLLTTDGRPAQRGAFSDQWSTHPICMWSACILCRAGTPKAHEGLQKLESN